MRATATTSSSTALMSSSCTDRRTLALSSSNTMSMVRLSRPAPYDNRFISVVTIEGRKIVQWRDYMDSLAAMTALDSGAVAIVWAPASCKGRHIRVRIYESPHGGRLLGWVSVRVAGKGSLWTASLHRI